MIFVGNSTTQLNAFNGGELRRYLLFIATVVAHNINRNHLRERLTNGFNDHIDHWFNQCSDGLRILKKVTGIRKATIGHEPVWRRRYIPKECWIKGDPVASA